MEGESHRGVPSPSPRLKSDRDLYDRRELSSSSASDASSVSDENRVELLRFSENFMLNDRLPWTNEKHNMYLNHLELSFVKNLHETKRLLASCADRRTISRKFLISDVASNENGSQQKIKSQEGDFHIIITRSSSSHKRKRTDINPPSVSKPLKYSKHSKRAASRVSATGSRRLCSNVKYDREVPDLEKEGSGQNFVAEDSRSETTAAANISYQDQNFPSLNSNSTT